MHIEKDIVVTLHYRLSDGQQEIENSFDDGVPMVYLHGHNNLITGLESELTGKQPGDQLSVTVAPEDGYGAYDESLKQDVPIESFAGLDPQPGMQFTADTENGPQQINVLAVNDEFVTVDGNHPFAGKTLSFEVEITELRGATPTELEHGHIHAGGGCCGGSHDDVDHDEAEQDDSCCGTSH
ncbi:MAG: peptidylprolyl isomerase [Gammaproteobacteria bacterium]|nr:peptidylprolyl isomerase [Gammaproteobacteria bacterium]